MESICSMIFYSQTCRKRYPLNLNRNHWGWGKSACACLIPVEWQHSCHSATAQCRPGALCQSPLSISAEDVVFKLSLSTGHLSPRARCTPQHSLCSWQLWLSHWHQALPKSWSVNRVDAETSEYQQKLKMVQPQPYRSCASVLQHGIKTFFGIREKLWKIENWH